MSDVFPVNSNYREHAFVDEAGFANLYRRSIEDNEGFWRERAAIIDGDGDSQEGATPDMLQWAPGLPKTRSGKIMRRILQKIAENDYGTLGDTSTLADPAVVDSLIENRRNR